MATTVVTSNEEIIEVMNKRDKILASGKTGIEILCEIFKDCQEKDIFQSAEKLKYFYSLLQEFTNNVPEKDEELITSSKKVVRYWEKNKENIRRRDCYLYYELLAFADDLKSRVIYFQILKQ